MRAHSVGWLFLALLGCEEGERFVPVDGLCRELAEDVCDARVSCCGASDEAACRGAEELRCAAALAPFASESGLSYDSQQAARTRASARATLDVCGNVPALASFFQGGLALGSACERPTQCASGHCAGEPRVCSDTPAVQVCAAPL